MMMWLTLCWLISLQAAFPLKPEPSDRRANSRQQCWSHVWLTRRKKASSPPPFTWHQRLTMPSSALSNTISAAGLLRCRKQLIEAKSVSLVILMFGQQPSVQWSWGLGLKWAVTCCGSCVTQTSGPLADASQSSSAPCLSPVLLFCLLEEQDAESCLHSGWGGLRLSGGIRFQMKLKNLNKQSLEEGPHNTTFIFFKKQNSLIPFPSPEVRLDHVTCPAIEFACFLRSQSVVCRN